MSEKGGDDILGTLGDFASKENWDKFFSIRGSSDSFEWYAEWPQLKDSLLSQLSTLSTTPDSTNLDKTLSSLNILVPACGNSRLSENLYDAGYRNITNIDFSKVVISDMLRRNVRLRPEMRWRIMDMTSMQFMGANFNAVVDKGGLDALMEPGIGSKLGSPYLTEVKRVLKPGGRFICLTLAESYVLGLLFSKFWFGWRMYLHAIPQKTYKKSNFCTFMVVAEKDGSIVPHQIIASFTRISLDCNGNQAFGIFEALENQNRIRKEFESWSEIVFSLNDLQLGVDEELKELRQGRRLQFTINGCDGSGFNYRAILLDAKHHISPFEYHCGVFLVSKCRGHEWLFSSEEGQWMVVASSKVARLIMVFLDNSHANSSMDDIQKDLSPMIKQLSPGNVDNNVPIPFMIASDQIKQRRIVHQVISTLTGSIIVEDIIYEKPDYDLSHLLSSNDLVFRRLTFQRSEGLVQSEALLIKGSSLKSIDLSESKKSTSVSKSRKKVNKRRNGLDSSIFRYEFSNDMVVDHNYLASSYHTGIISGFMLVWPYLNTVASTGRYVKAVVIGLGAGLFPMFLHKCMPFLDIEVVELDAVVLEVARDYFSFNEGKQLKVHIADGLQFVTEVARLVTSSEYNCDERIDDFSPEKDASCNGASVTNGIIARKFDILVIDVDSADLSSGMTCPAADFVEVQFLSNVKDALAEQGLFVINLVSRSPIIKTMVLSRIKSVFTHVFCLEVEEDVNDVIFALNTNAFVQEDDLEEAGRGFAKLVNFNERSPDVVTTAKKIKCLQ